MFGQMYPWWKKCWRDQCDLAVPDPRYYPEHIGLCDMHHEEMRTWA